MKKPAVILTFVVLALFFISCGEQFPKASKEFLLVHHKHSFKTDGTSNYIFEFEGGITNGTDRIYKKATVYMAIVFNLKNGQQLNDEDINKGQTLGFFSGLDAQHSVEMFQAHQTYELKKFISYPISKAYQDYPIENVLVNFRMVLYDEINDKTKEVFLKAVDITDEWKNAPNIATKADN